MILPARPDERDRVIRNLLRVCEVSREHRKNRTRRLRTMYLAGADDGDFSRYNKLREHVTFSSSYLYAPSTVKFGVTMAPHYGDEWHEEKTAARDELQHLWQTSGATMTVKLGVEWAHVWDTAVFKLVIDQGEVAVELVPDPADVGILHEDRPFERQEAIAHWYLLSVPEFTRLVDLCLPHETPAQRAEIAALKDAAESWAMPGYEAVSDMLPPTVARTILLSQAAPNMVGNVMAGTDTALALPRVTDPVVRLAELWVWDDERSDYRVFTHFIPTETVLWDTMNPLDRRCHPFHALTLMPTPGYAWGVSPLQYLYPLQRWREKKLAELDLRDDLQLDPPLFFQGLSHIDGERAKAFRRPGGSIASAMPNASVSPVVPGPLVEPFGMVERIDADFSRIGGLPVLPGMRGQTGEPGARSGEQQMTQALLTAGPTLDKAMSVEHCVAALATGMLRVHARLHGESLRTTSGREFFLSQLPLSDLHVQVWGHSHSPLYAEQVVQRAVLARDRGAMDNEDFLEYLGLPLTENLIAKSRKLAEAAAEKQERAIRIRETEAEARKLRATSR